MKAEIYLDGDCGLVPDPQSLDLFPKGTAIMPLNRRRSRFLPAAFGFCAGVMLGVLLCALFGDVLFYLALTLIPFGLIVRALEPLARKRGWGSEGLTHYLSRPRFDESRRRIIDPGRQSGALKSADSGNSC